ncbi:Uncharacterized protein TCM_043348 [Theobroma cacao]|uniref:Uncharacterized protein n=1 Tax=Theobroma cacao TaxID=3641 RepID=A0A061FNF1_THECC|nr:Uncharacterized protein TCM_043348 [Theobroma cacao]
MESRLAMFKKGNTHLEVATRLSNFLGRKVIKLKTRHVTKNPNVQGLWKTDLKARCSSICGKLVVVSMLGKIKLNTVLFSIATATILLLEDYDDLMVHAFPGYMGSDPYQTQRHFYWVAHPMDLQ